MFLLEVNQFEEIQILVMGTMMVVCIKITSSSAVLYKLKDAPTTRLQLKHLSN